MLQRTIILQTLCGVNVEGIAVSGVLLGHLIFSFISVSTVKHTETQTYTFTCTIIQ